MTRTAILIIILAAALHAGNITTPALTFNYNFVETHVNVTDPFNSMRWWLYFAPPPGYACTDGANIFYNDGGHYVLISDYGLDYYAWRGSATYCSDDTYTVCTKQQNGTVFPLPYPVIAYPARTLYNDAGGIVWGRQQSGVIASPVPGRLGTYRVFNFYTMDFSLVNITTYYYISTPGPTTTLTPKLCLPVNATFFPFFVYNVSGTRDLQRFIPLYIVKRGNNVYAAGLVPAVWDYYYLAVRSSVANYVLYNGTPAFGIITFTPYYGAGGRPPIILGPPEGLMFQDVSISEGVYYTEYGYAYYRAYDPVIAPSPIIVGKDRGVVVYTRGGNDLYSAPICRHDRLHVKLYVPYYGSLWADVENGYVGLATVVNNSSKTLYAVLGRLEQYSKPQGSLTSVYVFTAPPGGKVIVPLGWGSYSLYFTHDLCDLTQYRTFSLQADMEYIYDGNLMYVYQRGNRTEWVNYIKQLLQWFASLYNQTKNAVQNPAGYTYHGQNVITAATQVSTSTQLQTLYAFSVSTSGGGSAVGGFSLPSFTSISAALALLLAFAVAVGVAKSREDPADRLAAVYAVFVPTVVMLSLFFESDLAAAAAIAAALIALAYAIHAARL